MDIERIQEQYQEEIYRMRARIKGCFRDKRGLNQAEKYINGLLGDAERKNGWQLAESNGDSAPYAIQQFLYRGAWDPDEVRDALREHICDELGEDDGILVVDESGFLKQGKHSVGVKRQYSGTAGRVENCQIGVFITYASRRGFALMDRKLYLPREWIDDAGRRKEAGISEDIQFETKPNMALKMLQDARRAQVPFQWVTADSVYGDYHVLRHWLESQRKGYVLCVSGKDYVRAEPGLTTHVSGILENLPEEGWQTISAGEGSKGDHLFDWLFLPYPGQTAEGWQRCLMIRRSRTDGDFRAHVCFYPKGTSKESLTRIAGSRWTVKRSFHESKNEIGLDHYEVRSYRGWYRHITMACASHVLLAILKLRLDGGGALKKLL